MIECNAVIYSFNQQDRSDNYVDCYNYLCMAAGFSKLTAPLEGRLPVGRSYLLGGIAGVYCMWFFNRKH